MRYFVLIALLCVAGAPMPPKPAVGIGQGAGAMALMAVVIPPAPRTFTLTWCYPADQLASISEFRVYHTTNMLSRMSLYGSTPNLRFTITVNTNLPMEFFTFTAVSTNGFESQYARPGICQ